MKGFANEDGKAELISSLHKTNKTTSNIQKKAFFFFVTIKHK
jgi:hypothetical protein